MAIIVIIIIVAFIIKCIRNPHELVVKRSGDPNLKKYWFGLVEINGWPGTGRHCFILCNEYLLVESWSNNSVRIPYEQIRKVSYEKYVFKKYLYIIGGKYKFQISCEEDKANMVIRDINEEINRVKKNLKG